MITAIGAMRTSAFNSVSRHRSNGAANTDPTTTPVTIPWELSTKPPPDVIEGYKWELYNVMEDPTESNDLAEKMPEKVKELEKLEERVAKLSGGVAVIRVGAPTESEMNARKDALDDAISSTKAAVAEGIVAGGGLALLKAAPALDKLAEKYTGDERTGIQILRRALEAPARQIAENSSADGGVVVDRMLNATGNIGFDAARKEYVDLVEAGIIDPTKVVRMALENAVSVASVLLLSEATMTDMPEPAKAPAEHVEP